MIYDLNKSENIGQKNNGEYDICIIGSGAAGITIAQRLNKYNLKIALIEGGSHEFSRQSQDIYKGKLNEMIPFIAKRTDELSETVVKEKMSFSMFKALGLK